MMAGQKISVVLLGFLAAFAQAKILPQDSRIVNGMPVELGEIPYQVGLVQGGLLLCGGSLITPNYVVTAAHCVISESAESLEIQGGMIDLEDPQVNRKVSKIIVHENYTYHEASVNDIALVKLEKPIPITNNISYASLPEPGWTVSTNERAVVSGWGSLSTDGPSSRYLQKASVFIISQKHCKDIWAPRGHTIHDSQLCAMDGTTNKGFCYGDSGSPLTVNGKLVGIVSWSNFCVNTLFPNVYTRVSSYLDWIEKHAV